MDIKDVMLVRRFSDEKMSKVNLFETRNMFCDVYCLKPGQSQKIHSHDSEDKIYYVLEGEGTFFIGDKTLNLYAGQITLAACGQPHGVTNNSEEPLSLLVFMSPNPNFG